MIKRLKSNKQREAIANIKLSFLNKLTPVKIDQYIDNNVTDLASAKQFLKKLSKVILYLCKYNNLQ